MSTDQQRKTAETLIAENRRARHDYAISETVECGIELQGAEVKSLRAKHVSFKDAYAIVKDDQLVLVGLQIDRWKNQSTHVELEPTRTRKLLASKREIEDLDVQVRQKGCTLVPMKLYFKGPWAKVLIGVGKGKTHEDKRDDIKKRESDRDIARALGRRR
jgi:SsrA-binding protein